GSGRRSVMSRLYGRAASTISGMGKPSQKTVGHWSMEALDLARPNVEIGNRLAECTYHFDRCGGREAWAQRAVHDGVAQHSRRIECGKLLGINQAHLLRAPEQPA